MANIEAGIAPEEPEEINFSQKLLAGILLIVAVVYVLLLYVLDGQGGHARAIPIIFNGALTILEFLAIIFALLSVSIVLMTYAFFLPWAWKHYDPAQPLAFFKFFLALALSMSIVVFGLILGILSWAYSGAVDWNLFVPFLAVGEGHLILLYFLKIPRTYRLILGGTGGSRETRTGSKKINLPMMIIAVGIMLVLIILTCIAFLF